MAGLTSVLNLINEKGRSERDQNQLLTSGIKIPTPKDYALGTTPTGGLDVIKNYYGLLGQQGQATEHRRLAQTQLSNIGREQTMLNDRNFAEHRELSRHPERNRIIKQGLLDEALAKIQNYISPSAGSAEVAEVPGVAEVRSPGTAAKDPYSLDYRQYPGYQFNETVDGNTTSAGFNNLGPYDVEGAGPHTLITSGSMDEYNAATAQGTPIWYANDYRLTQGTIGSRTTQLSGYQTQLASYQNQLLNPNLTPAQRTSLETKVNITNNLINSTTSTINSLQTKLTEYEKLAQGSPEIPGEVTTPGIPGTPYQPGTPALPGSPYNLEETQGDATRLQSQIKSLDDIISGLSGRNQQDNTSFFYNRFNLTDPLQSPGKPEENFIRRNVQGTPIIPKVVK